MVNLDNKNLTYNEESFFVTPKNMCPVSSQCWWTFWPSKETKYVVSDPVTLKRQGWFVFTPNLTSSSEDNLQIQNRSCVKPINTEKSRILGKKEKSELFLYIYSFWKQRGISIMTKPWALSEPRQWFIRQWTWKCLSLNCVRLSATPWIVACQASPLPMGFSMQEDWKWLPFPSPEEFPHPGIKSRSSALQADSLFSETPGEPLLDNMRATRPYYTIGEPPGKPSLDGVRANNHNI